MKRLLLFLPLMLGVPAWAGTDPQVAAYKVPANAIKVALPPGGDFQRFEYRLPLTHEMVGRDTYHKGRLMERELFKHGRNYGFQRWWNAQGRLTSETPYKDGLQDGLSRQWDDKGRLIGRAQMKAGAGTWRLYYADGHLWEQAEFKKNEFDGRKIVCYPDGHVQTVAQYRAGKLSGLYLRMYPNGSLRGVAWLVGPRIVFSPDGTVRSKNWYVGAQGQAKVSEATYADFAANVKKPKLPPYFADATRYKTFYTPALQALVKKFNALPAVHIPLR